MQPLSGFWISRLPLKKMRGGFAQWLKVQHLAAPNKFMDGPDVAPGFPEKAIRQGK